MSLARSDLLAFARSVRFWALATTASGQPQAAIIGVAVTDRFELVFDTIATSRKAINLRGCPQVGLAM